MTMNKQAEMVNKKALIVCSNISFMVFPIVAEEEEELRRPCSRLKASDANLKNATDRKEAQIPPELITRCLKIGCCNNLRELPEDVFGSSLQRLSIESCPRLISLGVNGLKCPLPCLERLSIQYCVGLTTISDKMFESCQSLRSLSVECCPNLVSFSLNLQEMPSLEDFALLNCPKLIPHRFNGFAFATNLRKLWIGPFSSGDSSIDGFDWSGLRSASTLRKVHLEGLRHSDFLPHQLQYLTTLTSLNLKNFGGIEVLPDWIGNLVSLETLQLSNCEKLRCLLSEAAMRRLTKLTSVEVRRCPLLRQRYAPQRGIYLEE
nr:disease resistance protein RPP4-like [Coffea arabica]